MKCGLVDIDFNRRPKWNFGTYADSLNAVTGNYDDEIFIESDTLRIVVNNNDQDWSTEDFDIALLQFLSLAKNQMKQRSIFLGSNTSLETLDQYCNFFLDGRRNNDSWQRIWT